MRVFVENTLQSEVHKFVLQSNDRFNRDALLTIFSGLIDLIEGIELHQACQKEIFPADKAQPVLE